MLDVGNRTMKKTNIRIAFYDAKPYDKEFFLGANRNFGFNISFFETRLNKNTAALSRDHDAVCVFVHDVVDAAVIDQLQAFNIELLALRCAGYNNVDLQAAVGKLRVVRVPGYSPHAVAEHAMALILSLNRHTYQAYHRTRDGNFSLNGLLGFDLQGKVAGVIGTGSIGRCFIAILKGFGIEVLAYDPMADAEYEQATQITYTSLQHIYQQADIISLHCPLNENTFHIIDSNAIAQMKPGVMLINTGRGKLIDTQALISALKAKKIGSAGLDVYEEEDEYFFEDKSLEPIADDNLARLLTFPNVLITSHQGFFTREALGNISYTTLQNIHAFFVDDTLPNEVSIPASR